ncbi:unnamed protein product [Ambrosiozyma monospora]|uniref:Unnamed protein product n=1 Tax=Ambrosiozyma monospora TaxID=43982 RepID=A0A9W7DIA2_AMBMO|nr:unnamed protein product [Ambrosiozyma monospora]
MPFQTIQNQQEAYDVLASMWGHYWDNKREAFHSDIACKGVNSGIFDCWSMGVVVHALGDCCKIYKSFSEPMVEKAIKSSLRYRNPHIGGYSVYYHGGYNSGDGDICLDDCGHLTRGFIACYEATGEKSYLKLAKELMAFMMTGVVTHKVYGYKGLKWHYSKSYMSSISNCVAATAALKLIDYSEDFEKKQLVQFAEICLSFLWHHMRDKSDNLIRDGIGMNSTTMDTHKYSYNSGNTLTALCLMYKYTGHNNWSNKAHLLAEAILDRNRELFDQDYEDTEKRYLKDSSFFNQLWIEGVADYYEIMGTEITPEFKKEIQLEVIRHLEYFRKYCYDYKDGLYFMTFCANKLDYPRYEEYIKHFGRVKKFEPDEDDRVRDFSRPIESRLLCKSLIGAASASRIFFHSSRIVQGFKDPDDDD